MRKRLVSLALAIVMIAGIMPIIPVSASDFAGGNGSIDNPYQISTPEQLDAIRNDTRANYILINDIDLSGYNWNPIGRKNIDRTLTDFTGTFDGNYHTIYNLGIYVNEAEPTEIIGGLFGYGMGCTISNLYMENVNIGLYCNDLPTSYAGAIIAGGNNITIDNCVVSGIVNAGASGGIIGEIGRDEYNGICKCTVTNCTNNANINGTCAGGMVGSITSELAVRPTEITISSCLNNGNVTADRYAGGLLGGEGFSDLNNRGGLIKIENCTNTSAVTSGRYAGGIIGYIAYTNYPSTDHADTLVNLDIGSCTNNGSVLVDNNIAYSNTTFSSVAAGGIIGDFSNAPGGEKNIHDCTNNGSINVTQYNGSDYFRLAVGGIIGEISADGGEISFSNCINNRRTIGLPALDDDNQWIGGIIGRWWSPNTPLSFLSKCSYVKGNQAIGSTDLNDSDWIAKKVKGVEYLTTISESITANSNITDQNVSQNTEIDFVNYFKTPAKLGEWHDLLIETHGSDAYEAKVSVSAPEIAELKSDVLQLSDRFDLKGNPYKSGFIDLWCKNEGTVTVTVTLPDGTSASEDVTVDAEIAETLNDETILRAKMMLDNPNYTYYRNSTSVTQQMMQNQSAGTAVFYKNLKDLLGNLLTGPKDKSDYYELFLLDLLSNEESEKFFGEYAEIMENDIVKYIIKDVYGDIQDADFIMEGFAKDDLLNLIKSSPGQNDTVMKYFEKQLDNTSSFKLSVSPISAMYAAAGTMDAFVEKATQLYGLVKEYDIKCRFLDVIINNSTYDDMKEAAERVKKHLENAAEDTCKYAMQQGLKAGVENVAEFATNTFVDAVLSTNPYALLYKKTFDLSFMFDDAVLNTDALSQGFINLETLNYIEDAARNSLSSAESRFKSNETKENAENLLSAANMLYTVLASEFDYVVDFLNATKDAKTKVEAVTTALKDWPWVDSEALWDQYFTEREKDQKQVDSIKEHKKRLLKANFYDCSDMDIAAYIRQEKSTVISDWAKENVNKAINYEILPDYMQNNYQNNITRAEFCTLLENMLVKKTGLPIDWLILSKGDITRKEFDDTIYKYVSDISKLGIVSGVGNNSFNPLGDITRQEAAVMLMRTANILDYDTSAPETDLSGAADWAREGVNFVVDRKIMTGTNNGFEPKGKYTKEQAITALVRFYENLKK